MVDEIAVNPPVTVLKRMDIDKAKRQNGRSNNRVNFSSIVAIKFNYPVNQLWQSFMARTDMIRKRDARVLLMLADKATFIAKTKTDEPLFTDHDALQTQEFILVERLLASFTDGFAPALYSAVRRRFAFDGVAGF